MFIIILMTITLTYQLLFSLAFKYLIDDILGAKNYELLIPFLATVVIGAIISSLADVLNDYLVVKLGVTMENKFRLLLFSHLQRLPDDYYTKSSSGIIQTRTSVDLNNIVTGFLNIQPIIYSMLGIIFSVVLLFSLDWLMTFITIIGILIATFIPRIMVTNVLNINEEYKSQTSRFGELFYERLTAHRLFRTFGLHEWEYKRISNTIDNISPLAVKSKFSSILMHKVVVISLLMMNVTIISLGVFLIFNDIITIGEIVAFQSFYIAISGYIAKLTNYFPSLSQSSLSLKRIDAILNERSSNEEIHGNDYTVSHFNNTISFDNVSFYYSPNIYALNNINLTIPFYSKCAIVGSSGSGKTSIVSLLLRLYEPTKGNILFDDVNISSISSKSFRKITSYVPQDITLLNLSIRDNIRLGNLIATDQEIEEAAKAADIHNWILSLPDGYNFIITERGINLSGGQRQRIALARAFLRQPSILILDEATSALDPGTENFINQTINKMVESSTIISVTHRLQSIIDSNIIFVMDKGCLVASGTHDYLLTHSDLYQKMWRKQSGFYISDSGLTAEMTVERMQQIPLFSELDLSLLEEIRREMGTEHFEENRIVMNQGDKGDKFYIIVRGRVEVVLNINHSEEKLLAILEDGDYFGEMALLKEIPRTATIRTIDPCTFLTMQRDLFQQILEKSPRLKKKLEDSYGKRLAEQTAK